MSTVVYPSHKAVDLLFKKGDRLQTKNWRPISLLVYNIYPRLAPSSVHRTTPNRLGSPVSRRLKRGCRPGVDEASLIRGEHLSSMLSPCHRFGICAPFSFCQAGLPPDWTKPFGPFFGRANVVSLPDGPCTAPNPLAVLESWISGPRLMRCAFSGSDVTSRIPRPSGRNSFLSCCAGLLAPTPASCWHSTLSASYAFRASLLSTATFWLHGGTSVVVWMRAVIWQ